MPPSDSTQKTSVIIVTHNSAKELEECLRGLVGQSVQPCHIYIVDSCSEETGYLREANQYKNVTVLQQERNVGFSRGNNIGYGQVLKDTDYVLFINPDTLLDTSFVEQAEKIMERDQGVGILTGRLLGYDFARKQSTGRIDSTGIFRKWYGRWYDRAQGERNRQQYLQEENIPVACGALLFCRKKALDKAALSDGVVFDPDFFLYKEDIELSLRVRKEGWHIRYVPGLIAFHGRGWQQDRKKMGRKSRLTAARNEILLYRKHPSPYMFWAWVKYLLVAALNV